MPVNGQIIISLIAGVVILVMVILMIRELFPYSKRYRFYKKQRQFSEERSEREILQIQVEVQEQTMRNISQEIHDNIGQVLSLAKLHLSSIEINNNPQACIKISRSMQLVSKAVTDLRDLSKTMDADNITRAGLVAAVRSDLELISATGIISTSFNLEGTALRLGPSIEIIIYRIVQEVLNNILKHSNASNIIVDFTYAKDVFSLTVTDNGVGFENRVGGFPDVNGSGIRNIFSRAKLIGANISIETAPGHGTIVQLMMQVLHKSL